MSNSNSKWWWVIIKRLMMRSAIIQTLQDARSMTLPLSMKRCAIYADPLETEKTSSLAPCVENLSTPIVFSYLRTMCLSTRSTGNVWTANSANSVHRLRKRRSYSTAMCVTKPSTLSVWSLNSKPFLIANGNAKNALSANSAGQRASSANKTL